MNFEDKSKELAQIITLECIRQIDLIKPDKTLINEKVNLIADLYKMYYCAIKNNEKVVELFNEHLLP